MKLVAFDLETTGTEPEADRIVEFCFIELTPELEEKGRWGRLVNPGRPMPPEVVAVHGITDDMVANEPPFATHASRIQRLVEGAVLVGHSVRFDVAFLHAELVRAGQPGLQVNHATIDTVQIERAVNSHRLASCFERYTGKPMADAHRSEADIQATVEVLRAQRQAHADRLPASLEGLIGPQLHRHFHPDEEVREWLDHGRKFYDEGGRTFFGFGKFRGQAIDAKDADHTSYLAWMKDRDFPEDTKRVVGKLLAAALAPKQSTLP